MIQIEYIIAIAIYSVIMILIGFYGAKITKDLKDYFVAGGKLSGIIAGFSLIFTSVSASAIVGSFGTAYATGLGSVMCVTAAFGIGGPIAFYILGRPLKRLSSKLGALTIPELLGKRYYSDKIQYLAAIFVIVFMLPLLVAQFKGAGVLFEKMLGIPYIWGLVLFGAIVVIYTSVGGFFSVAYTDFVQGLIVIIAILMVLPAAIAASGGWTETMTKWNEAMPGGTGVFGYFGPALGLSLFFSLLFGNFGAPHNLIRFYSVRKGEIGKMLAIWAIVQILLIYLYLAAPSAKVLLPGIKDPDMVLPSLVMRVLPTALAAFFMIGILAAIMSTADSILLVHSSAFMADFFKKIKPEVPEKTTLKISRILSFAIGIIALIISITPPDIITFLMAWSFGLFAVTFSTTLIAGFYWKRATKEGAFSALIGGAVAVLIWGYLKQPFGIMATFVGIIVAAILLVVVSLLTPKPPENVVKTFFGK
jgi:SSS family transporter